MKTFDAVVSAPGFSLGIRCNQDEITAIEFLEPRAEVAPKSLLAKEAVRQLRAWLKDSRHSFSLPLAPQGTPFQRKVWSAIAAIPAGKTRQYGEIATKIARRLPQRPGAVLALAGRTEARPDRRRRGRHQPLPRAPARTRRGLQTDLAAAPAFDAAPLLPLAARPGAYP